MKVLVKLFDLLKGMRTQQTAARAKVDVASDSAADLQLLQKRCGKTEASDSAADLQGCKSEAEFQVACKSAAESVAAMRGGRVLVDPCSTVPKKSRFQKKLEMAMMPRCRKHKVRGARKAKFVRPSSRLEAVLDDYATDPRRFGVDCSTRFVPSIYSCSRPSGCEVLMRAAGALTVAAAMDVGEAACRLATARRRAAEREAELATRRKYYAAENDKRRREAATIREAMPPPENPMPTPEQLIAAYGRRHENEEAKIRLGMLMVDLEEHVRYQLVLKEGKIAGTVGGVREWMERNCPELAKHYHTCQRFKRKVQDDPTLVERQD